MLLVGIDDTPGTTGIGVIIGDTFFGCFVYGILGVECVPVLVLWGADRRRGRHCVALDDGIVISIELGVNPKTE